jgi:hypothetical protein
MAYSLSPWLKPRFFITGTNRPLAGGLMYTYKAGTTDPATTYSDDAGTTNTNPIQLDSDGQCDLFLDDAVSYRIILKNSAGVTQFDKDRIASIGSTQVQSFNSIAALRLRSGTTIANAAKTLGYYSAGDGGGNSFYWDGTSTATDNGATVIKPTSVSGAGRWLAIKNTASLRQRGAIGNYQYYAVSHWYTAGTAYYRGFANLAAVQAVYPHVTASTDSIDFAVIQSAINASYDTDLVIPTGGYNLRAARADKILEIRNRINIIGSYGTNFVITADTPNSQDVIQINPTSIADEGVELHNIWIYELSGTPARDILRVNLDETHGLKKLRLFGCLFRTSNAEGRAVRILNPANINANGLFSTNIQRNEFIGGFYAEGLGDSVRIKDNTFAGFNIGIDIAMLPASAATGTSAKLSIKDNNITSLGGAIVIRVGRGVTIADNNIEQLVDLTGGACITLFDLDSGLGGKSVITNNKIEPNDPGSKCYGISMIRCKNTAVVNNQIGTSAKTLSYTAAVLLSECENVQVHYNDSYLSDGCFGVIIDAASKNISYKKGKIRPFNSNFTEIENASTSTSGYRIIPALLNDWVVAGSGQFQYAQFTKNDGVVSLDGVIARAMTVGDHVIMTLPVGMRPSLRVMSICYAYYASGDVGFCNVRVDPDGSVYLSKRSNTTQDILELSLNGINFNAADA